MKSKSIFFFLLLILIIAIFFRFWKINQIPPGLYPDEAMNGNNALEAIKTGSFKIFYPENNGREGLFINIQAISLMIFGNQAWALRIVSALFGFFTVLGLFFLTKNLFPQKPLVPHFAVFLLAVSFWHVNFSRIGFRAIMVPFCLVWSFAFLLMAIRKKKIIPAIAAGIFFGAGFHTYIAFRFAPLLAVIPIFKAHYFSGDENYKTDRKIRKIIIIWLVIAFVVALPIGLYFLNNPGDFFGRSGQVSIFQSSNPILSILKSVGKTLIMFNISGDCNWRHNLSCWPQLNPLVGLGFLLGVYLLIKNLIKKSGEKTTYQFIIVWLVAMAFPSILTTEGLPHALRSIGLIPIVFILAGLGINMIWEWLKNKINNKHLTSTILCLFLIVIAIFEGWRYFGLWANNPHTQDAFSRPYWDIGQYLNKLPTSVNKYIVVNAGGVLVKDIPMAAQTVMFLTDTYLSSEQKNKNFNYFLPENIDKIEIKKPAHLIPLIQNDEIKNIIIKKCPDCQFKDYSSFWVFENK